MTNEQKKEVYEKIVVKRDGGRDLSFSGMCIASSSDRENNSTRWTDCSIYKTAKGNYIYGEERLTMWTGEHDVFSAEKFESLEKLFAWLEGENEPYGGAAKELAEQCGFDLTEHVD